MGGKKTSCDHGALCEHTILALEALPSIVTFVKLSHCVTQAWPRSRRHWQCYCRAPIHKFSAWKFYLRNQGLHYQGTVNSSVSSHSTHLTSVIRLQCVAPQVKVSSSSRSARQGKLLYSRSRSRSTFHHRCKCRLKKICFHTSCLIWNLYISSPTGKPETHGKSR